MTLFCQLSLFLELKIFPISGYLKVYDTSQSKDIASVGQSKQHLLYLIRHSST
ncbi:MAG: hypothetical protein HON76_16510 [Candidatus Scalindua sp.]|nr:hypothetical protein [Candidatus Scalindua sp.]MBT6564119.1 hypothetical protein [Candidatus Scalindua sp.]